MSIFRRFDVVLGLGVAIAVAVLFARPLTRLLDAVRAVEQSWGIALIPAVLILCVVLVLHLQNLRRELLTQSRATAAGAEATASRANELEQRLTFFSEAVSQSPDLDSVRDAIIRHLPPLVRGDNAWVLIRTAGGWQSLVSGGRDPTKAREIDLAREALADGAMATLALVTTPPASSFGAREMCLPLVVGTIAVGALGVPISDDDAVEGSERRRLYESVAAILALVMRNALLFRELRDGSLRDGLTGLFNRTHTIELLDGEVRRARRSHAPISVVMFDLDFFKNVNDRYGHLCGDAVLAAVGRRLQEVVRTSDYKCRYGGEEFLLVLPDTPLANAQLVAENVRRELAKMAVAYEDQTVSVTGSFGVTAVAPGEIDATAIIARADAALYEAKHSGRNCIRVTEP